MPRDQDAVRESGDWGLSYADPRRFPAAATRWIPRIGLSFHRRDGVLRGRGRWSQPDRRHTFRVAKKRCLRSSVLVSCIAPGSRRGRIVQLFRSPRAQGVGIVARRGSVQMKINVTNVINDSRVSAFQVSTYLLCFACLLMDGFDVQSLGYVAPALSAELHISRAQLGPVLSAAPLGVLIGSILCSMLADKIGRRPVLIATTLFYALLTWLTARADSLE